MKADLRQRNCRRGPSRAWAASMVRRHLLAAIVTIGVALALRAADTASTTYRVDGNLTPAAGGSVVGASYALHQVVGQPEALGEAHGSLYAVEHGWRIPAPVAQLYRYALEAGWSLKGSPGVSDQTIGTIFTGAAGAPTKVGNLQYANPDGSLVAAADSDPVLDLQAFWVFSYWGGTGQPFAAPEAHQPGDGTHWHELLEPGWNLFSPPYVVTVPPRSTGIVVVWRWDSAAATYELVLPGRNLFPLDGYWIFVSPELP